MKRAACLLSLFLFGFAGLGYSQAGLLDFYIYNNSGYNIYSIYCTPTGDSFWGDDLIDSDILYNGETADITFTGEDSESTVYDIRIIDEFNDEVILPSVDLAAIWGLRIYNDKNWQLQAEISYVGAAQK